VGESIIDIDWSLLAILELLTTKSFKTVLDVGSGSGSHSNIFRLAGKDVVSIDKFTENSDIKVDLLDYDPGSRFDCIFCSHVVEHQRNVGLFLDKIHSLLSDDGILCITGPCHSPDVVIEGHLMPWTAVTGVQALVMAGFDCSGASIYQIYETGIICKKAREFESVSASYKFNNLALWPLPPKSGFKWVTDNGIFVHNLSPLGLRFGGGSGGAIHKFNVKDCDKKYDFKITSKRFTNDISHFLNE